MTKINTPRITETFLELVQIDSPSYEEKNFSDFLMGRFKDLGCSVQQDSIGNLVASFAGDSALDTVMLCAHMDTVRPGNHVKPQLKDGCVSSDGTTILGADDKSGIAVILETLQILNENPQLRHAPIEAVITVQEEVGIVGSRELDKDSLKSTWGIVLDHGGPIGRIVISGPTARAYRFIVHGVASHAAAAPEKGINAIKAAALGIVKCPCGQIDPEVVSGIGVIQGGLATNIVPDRVTVDAMIRSRKPQKFEKWCLEMEKAFAEGCAEFGARLEIEKNDSYFSYELDENSKPWRRIEQACHALGFAFDTEHSLGGTDANNFNLCGIATCAVSTGMANAHMLNEFICIQDMVDCTTLMLACVCDQD